MRPQLSTKYLAHRCSAYAERRSHVARRRSGRVHVSRFSHGEICHLSVGMPLSNGRMNRPTPSTLLDSVFDVVEIGASEQVCRIDAASIVAAMKNVQSARYGADVYFVGHAMSGGHFPIEPARSITGLEKTSSPFPAPVALTHLLPKRLDGINHIGQSPTAMRTKTLLHAGVFIKRRTTNLAFVHHRTYCIKTKPQFKGKQ